MSNFEATGAIDSARLQGPRLDVQWALQIPAAASATLPGGDDRHALTFDGDVGGLLTAEIPAAKNLRFGLKVRELTLVAAKDDGYEALPLQTRSLAEGLAWIGERAGVANLGRPNFVLPSHAVVRGGLFMGEDKDALAELERWIGNAFHLLPALDSPGVASCAPRTFAIVRSLEGGLWAGAALGDRDRPAPYWFVRPSQAPSENPSVNLDGDGRWHDGGWFGAILPGEELRADDKQAAQVRAFLKSACAAMRQ